MDWLKAKGRPESITTPLLVVGAGKDRICITPQTRALAKRMPRADYLEIADAGHEIMMESAPFRASSGLLLTTFFLVALALANAPHEEPRPGIGRGRGDLRCESGVTGPEGQQGWAGA